jgi:hypothetical protein
MSITLCAPTVVEVARTPPSSRWFELDLEVAGRNSIVDSAQSVGEDGRCGDLDDAGRPATRQNFSCAAFEQS